MLAKFWQVARWLLLAVLVSCLLFLFVNITETAIWKLLELLIVPSALPVGVWWLNKKQKETEIELAERRAIADRQLEKEKQNEDRIQ